MEEKDLHKFAELDFSGVAVIKIGEILNLFNQRLARIEDITYMKDGSGHIITNENGEPVTLTEQYLNEAREALKKAEAEAQAKASDNTPKAE